MSEITHQEALSLLQAAADQILKPGERSTLDRHLSKCQECSEYANNLSALEANLHTAFRKHWDQHKPADLEVRWERQQLSPSYCWDISLYQISLESKIRFQTTKLRLLCQPQTNSHQHTHTPPPHPLNIP